MSNESGRAAPSVRATSERPVVLVIGGSSGIGLAVAQRLGTHPLGGRTAALALAARDPGALVEAAAGLSDPPQLLPLDVSDGAAVQAAVEAVVEEHGRLDAVVLTAQTMAYGTVEQVPAEVFEQVVETAVHGTAHVIRAVVPHFRSQGSGTLVVVNSLLGEIAVPSMSAYVAAKWGQLGLVRSLQLELREEPGIDVCLVSPGAVDTPIYTQAATYAGSEGSAPAPVVSPERVARAVVSCLERPRRHVEVGPANTLAVLGFRTAPALYDRLAAPLVRRIVLRGPAAADDTGNVLAPRPGGEGLRGGWTLGGRRRDPDGEVRWRWSRTAPRPHAEPVTDVEVTR